MELELILGPNGSGKSLFAESEAVRSGGSLVYLATMIPQTPDNFARIEKHRRQRADKGFRTVECGWEIDQIAASSADAVLLEDASNLLANGIFAHGASGDEALRQILALADRTRKLIVVSIEGLLEAGYNAETAAYIRALNALNAALAQRACAVYRMEQGVPRRLS